MLATVQDSMLTDGAKLAALPNVSAAPNDATKFLNGQGSWTQPTGAVSSVFGRTGVVSAQSGDYTAAQVGAPSGSGTSTGTNTGDQTNISGNAATATTAGTVTTASQPAITSVGTLSGLTVTATITGSISGNSATATALATARAINGVNFDGTAPITVTAAAGTLSGTTLNATVVTSSLTSVGTLATGVWQGTAIGDSYIASALTGKSVNSVTLSTAAGATNFLAGDGTYKAVSSSVAAKTGTATKNLADADATVQNIAHGLGKTPKLVNLYAVIGESGYAPNSQGCYDGTNNESVFTNYNAGATNTNSSSAYAIAMDLNGTDFQGAVAIVDATNITLTWHKIGTPTGIAKILWSVIG